MYDMNQHTMDLTSLGLLLSTVALVNKTFLSLVKPQGRGRRKKCG